MAVYLVIWACLGTTCERVEMPSPWSLTTCLMTAQIEGANWINEHMPGGQLRYVRCIPGQPA